MKNYDRYSEAAVRFLLHFLHREGEDAAMLAAHAMVDVGSAISQHELRKAIRRTFSDTPDFPDDGPFTMYANGEKITVYREPITSQHLPPAA